MRKQSSLSLNFPLVFFAAANISNTMALTEEFLDIEMLKHMGAFIHNPSPARRCASLEAIGGLHEYAMGWKTSFAPARAALWSGSWRSSVSQILHLIRGRSPDRVAGQLGFASFQELFGPDVVHGLGNALAAA